MRLKKLVLHGFKSFADRVEVTFEDGITGVVGPNGCGKSNIADAVRWVLGEQSAKTLRGAKMEDVIFNGTEKRRRLAFCEVTLTFDNEDKALPVDFTEVEVSRRVYRSGEGEYKLNGAPCRLRDIVDLFRDTGIGKEGYSLIGQGRIDDILSVRSEDRRKVFEEAAGIVKYKTRKLDAQRRMENTRQNLTRVEDILSELETRVEPLKEQSETAREYLALRDELKVLDINVYLVRTERYQARLAELRETLETLSEAVSQAEEELKAVSAAREEGLVELDGLEREAASQREVVQKWIREVEAREGAVQVMRERILAGERERDRLLAERDAAREGGGGVRRHVEELQTRIESETGELAALEAEQSAREEELAKFEAELSALEEQAEAEKEQIIQSMNRLGDVRNQQARLETLRTALEGQLASMDEDGQRAEAGARSLDEQLAAARALVQEESGRKAHFEREVAASVEQVRVSSEQSQKLSERVNAIVGERQRADSRLKLLVEMQNDYEGYQHSVKQVLLYARKSGAAGVHGVVAELIEVPEKLERAIDMVLGGALQNIVVERDEDAKRMIEYLRNNRFGRATFLPIGSVRPRVLDAREREVLKLPGCLGVASELVRFDGKYRGVIDNLLGRTVVAENLEAGIRIQRAGRYAFRLVTLEGDVMHSGGSMTGGSVQSRVTNLLSRGREIEELRKRLGELDDEAIAARNELVRQEAERTRLKQERGELYDELHRQEVACARAEAQLKAVEDEQAAHAASVERVHVERERLEAQLDDVKRSLSAIEEHQQSAQENTQDRQERVRALMEDIYARREKGEKLRAETGDGRVQLATRQRGLEAARADHERLSRQAEGHGQAAYRQRIAAGSLPKDAGGERRPAGARQRGAHRRQGRARPRARPVQRDRRKAHGGAAPLAGAGGTDRRPARAGGRAYRQAPPLRIAAPARGDGIQADRRAHLGGLRTHLRAGRALPPGGLPPRRIGKAHFRHPRAHPRDGRGQRFGAGRISPDRAAPGRDDLPARRFAAGGAGPSEHRRRAGTQDGEPVQARVRHPQPELPAHVRQALWRRARGTYALRPQRRPSTATSTWWRSRRARSCSF